MKPVDYTFDVTCFDLRLKLTISICLPLASVDFSWGLTRHCCAVAAKHGALSLRCLAWAGRAVTQASSGQPEWRDVMWWFKLLLHCPVCDRTHQWDKGTLKKWGSWAMRRLEWSGYTVRAWLVQYRPADSCRGTVQLADIINEKPFEGNYIFQIYFKYLYNHEQNASLLCIYLKKRIPVS